MKKPAESEPLLERQRKRCHLDGGWNRGMGVMPERVCPRGKAVYLLPEGPKVVS